MEHIFYNQLEDMFEVKKINEGFGKKYLINGQKKSKEKLKGTLERYCLSEEYELVLLKTRGKMKQKLFNPRSKLEIFRIVHCINGELIFESDNEKEKKRYRLKKEDVIIQRRSPDIKLYNLEGNDFECMIIEFYIEKLRSNLMEIIRENDVENWEDENIKKFEKGIYYNTSVTKEIKNLLNEIQHISNVSNINKYLEFKSKVVHILTVILEHQKNYLKGTTLSTNEIVNRIKYIIDDSPIENIPKVKELCEMLSLSRYQMNILFEKSEGIGILEYIQKKKMEYSKILLKETNKSILHISNEIGYENPSKFSRAFSKYYGILPSKYRMKIKK